MAKHKATKVYMFRVTVRVNYGARGGVWDMLRYDSCVPASELDSGKLGRLAGGHADDKDKEVELLMYSRSGNGPTEGRWRSFGCQIVNVEPLSWP